MQNLCRNICFIGMPTAGKTSIGRAIALKRHMNFIDTDDIIRDKYKMKLNTLIREKGREGFLKIEEDTSTALSLRNLDADIHYHFPHYIFSPGGSMVYSDKSINHFKNNLKCKIYHLHISYHEFLSRVGNKSIERGVISACIRARHTPIRDSLKLMYDERLELYEKSADATIVVNDRELAYNVVSERIRQEYPSDMFLM